MDWTLIKAICTCNNNKKQNNSVTFTHYLQTLLAEQDHKEVDEVRRQNLKEENNESVHNTVGTDCAIRVPETTVKRVFVPKSLSSLENLPPSDGLYTSTGYVVGRHLIVQVSSGKTQRIRLK